MAALIASPKNSLQKQRHTECHVYLWKRKKNTSKVSLYCVSFQFVLYDALKKSTKKGKPNEKRTTAKQKDWSLQSLWLGLQPSDSQFTVQIDTDYRHMICLGLAPVHIDIFCFVLYFLSLSLPTHHQWLT